MEVLLCAPKSEMLNLSLPDCSSAAPEKATHFSLFCKEVCPGRGVSWPLVENGQLNDYLTRSHFCIGAQHLHSILCPRKSWGLNIFSCFTISNILLPFRDMVCSGNICLIVPNLSVRTMSYHFSTVQGIEDLGHQEIMVLQLEMLEDKNITSCQCW